MYKEEFKVPQKSMETRKAYNTHSSRTARLKKLFANGELTVASKKAREKRELNSEGLNLFQTT